MNHNDIVLSLKNDVLFKAVYGSNTEESNFILINLLNKILDRQEDPIKKVEIQNPFHEKDFVTDKESILDIKALTDSDELFDIEMQIVWEPYMKNRLLFYHGGLLRDALRKGESYGKMKPTITICITDSIVFRENENYMNQFYFMEEGDGFKFSEITKICCIELPKVNPDRKPIEQLTPLEVCLEYLRYADENESEYVDELIRRGGKELEMAQEIMTRVTEEDRLRAYARSREMYQRDQVQRQYELEKIETGKAELKVGREELEADRAKLEADRADLNADRAELNADRADLEASQAEFEIRKAEAFEKIKVEAAKETSEKIASEMKAMGISSKQIMQITGLTETEINKL